MDYCLGNLTSPVLTRFSEILASYLDIFKTSFIEGHIHQRRVRGKTEAEVETCSSSAAIDVGFCQVERPLNACFRRPNLLTR